MNLLPPQEAKKASTQEEGQAKRRLTEIVNFLNQGERELNKFRQRDKEERAAITEDFRTFSASVAKEKQKLTDEVLGLEARKREALAPLDALKRELDDRERDLTERHARVVARENEAELREKECSNREASVARKQENIEAEKLELKARERQLAKDRADVDKWANHREGLIKQRMADLRKLFEQVDNIKK